MTLEQIANYVLIPVSIGVAVEFYRRLNSMSSKVVDLWDWHNREDPVTGIKVWYMTKSFEEAVMLLAKNVDNQTRTLAAITDELKDNRRDLKDIVDAVERVERKQDK